MMAQALDEVWWFLSAMAATHVAVDLAGRRYRRPVAIAIGSGAVVAFGLIRMLAHAVNW